ncbi:LacI family DNA-binding transcriptional regulator [Paenibacillus sp.]|uniref:LacI family DNA-binding transcriptional regulator n=1 Tax=Paenibacillus sp. TaxID=58172 RepID=UPI002811968A|nr:LacI family DNA-binding transcriptional regulator [Paenibacillus sp.]
MTKKLTVKDVAREAGVSTATVSRVLNRTGYVSESVREQVLGVVERLKYQPNSIARSLKQEKSYTIGIVIPDMTNPYFMTIARHIQRRCMSAGYHLLFMDSEEDAGKESVALDLLMEKRVEAIVLAGTDRNREKLESIRANGTALVLIDRRIDGVDADIVCEDNANVTFRAVSELLDRGHTRIGVIAGPEGIVTARERYEGIAAALREKSVELDPALVYEGDYTKESGRGAVRSLLASTPPPTAVVSCNNEMTYGFYLGLQEAGIDTASVEVVSFGDLEFSPLFRQRLTVIKQDPVWIGATAGDTVLARISEPSLEKVTKIRIPTVEAKS